MSPTLLSRRLKEMEVNGLVTRVENPANGDIAYLTTQMAKDLEPVAHALSLWAHRNIDVEVTLGHLDPRILMWNVRRKLDASRFPRGRRTVIQFTFPEVPDDQRNYWLIAKPGTDVDLCLNDPGHDVDLYITADLKALTSAWMGYSQLSTEIAREKITLIGDPVLARSIDAWMVRSSLAMAA